MGLLQREARAGRLEEAVVAEKQSHCLNLCPVGKLLTSIQYRSFFSMAPAIAKAF